jgi:hypothetical protein
LLRLASLVPREASGARIDPALRIPT